MPNDNVLTDDRIRQLAAEHRILGRDGNGDMTRSYGGKNDVLNLCRAIEREVLAAHPGQSGIACAGGHGITGLGRMTNDDDGFVRLQFVTEADADAFMEAYRPTVDVSEMPEPRTEAADWNAPCTSCATPRACQYDGCRKEPRAEVPEQPSLTNPLTPYGMLVRALRIVAGTTLYDMAKHLQCGAAELSAVEFGRRPVTDEILENTAAYFTTVGVPFTLRALMVARAGESHD